MSLSRIGKDVSTLNRTSDPTSPWWHIDLIPVVMAICLSLIGGLGIFSATRGRDIEEPIYEFVTRHAMFASFGFTLMVIVIVLDYRHLQMLAPPIYLVSVTLLVGLRYFGTVHLGAKSWYDLGPVDMQPSEFAKLGVIVTVAAVLSRAPDGPLPLNYLATILGLCAVPLYLIIRQPDLGTAVIIVVIIAIMLLVGRAAINHLITLTMVTVMTVAIAWQSTELIGPHAKKRFAAFLDPTGDAYNLRQAQITVGNGGITGQGFGQGPQTRSAFVPEAYSDFIFTAIAEDFGFIGCAVLLSCFIILIGRAFRIASTAGDSFGGYIVTGVLAMLAFQVFQSVGMSLGIMPITGIPLPFVSYGGSSAVTSWVSVGLLINVSMRRFKAGIDAEVQAGI